MAPDTAAFRAEYRAAVPRWYLGAAHFAATSLGSLAAIALCLRGVHAARPLEWLTVPLTFLFANFVEYRGHKGPMHRPLPLLGLVFQRHTLQHHRFFTSDAMECEGPRDFRIMLFPVLLIFFFLGLHLVPLAFVLSWAFGPNVWRLCVATGIGYFLTYEWLHFAYHVPGADRVPILRALRRHHLAHHDPAKMGRWNFNITFPICDAIFGTTWRG